MRAILSGVIIAVGLASCQTTQTGKSPGEVASETVQQHPGTVVGAGAGAVGGAVVGGLAGGTKGAVIGGLLGGLAGGVIGNYIERRDDAPAQAANAPASGSTPVAGSPAPARPDDHPGLRMDRVQMTPAVVPPGGTVNLGATYTVSTPADQWLTVRESREVRYQGELVANPTTQVSRTNGTYTTSLPITLPSTAANGPYEVTTTVALGDRRASQTTTFHVR
jgi:hypothetical protein